MKKVLLAVFLSTAAQGGTSVEVGDPQIGSSMTGGTAGSILFIGTGPVIAQNNSGLFWNNSTLRFGVRTASPAAALDIEQDSATVPALVLGNATSAGPLITVFDHTAGHTATIIAPTAFTSSYNLILPPSLGVSGGFLQTDLSGNLSFVQGVTLNTVQGLLAGISAKNVASVASTANVASISGLPTIDGVDLSMTSGGNVLLKNQTDDTTNGLYLVSPFGVWTRDITMPDGSCDGMIVTVGQGGTLNAGTVWLSSCNGSDITFTRIGHGPAIVSSTSNTSATCSASCTGIQLLKGGGCTNSDASLGLDSTYPSSATAWSCTYTLATGNCTAKAICE